MNLILIFAGLVMAIVALSLVVVVLRCRLCDYPDFDDIETNGLNFKDIDKYLKQRDDPNVDVPQARRWK